MILADSSSLRNFAACAPPLLYFSLRGWFGLDLVATLVAIFDIFSFVSGDPALQKMQIFRTLRVLRLAKLLRLLRGIRIFRRGELRVRASAPRGRMKRLTIS